MSAATGTVTFLFTDIEESTRRWEHYPDAMNEDLARHDALLHEIIEAHGGRVFKTIGDAFCAAFPMASAAVEAAQAAQQALQREVPALRVRMAVHTGEAVERDGDYFGPALNRVARLLAAGHGGQMLLSATTAAQLPSERLAALDLRSLGVHRLRDIAAREAIFQLLAPGLPAEFPPLNTLDVAFRQGLVRAALIATVVIAVVSGLALTAMKEARRADQHERAEARQRRLAEEAKKDIRRHAYASQTNLAQRELEVANRPRAEELLLMQRPGPGETDLRGWEWRYLWRLAREDDSLATIDPNLWNILSVGFSPDGRTLAMSDIWGEVKLYDVATRRERADLGRRVDGAGRTVTFSPDGRLLACPGNRSHVRLWDLRRGRQAALLDDRTGPTGAIGPMQFSPDGRLLAVSSSDGTVKLWDVATWRAMASLVAHPKAVASLAFSRDSHLLATSGDDQTVALWDTATRRELARLQRLGDVMSSLAFSPDGKILAAGSYASGTINLWDVATRQIAATLRGSRAAGVSVAFSPDGRQLAAGGGDGVLRLWDLATRRERAALVGHEKGIVCVAFSPDGKTIASGGNDGTVKLWRPVPKPQTILPGAHGGINHIAVAPDGNTLASGSRDGWITLWDVRGERRIAAFKGPSVDVRGLVLSPDGKRLAFWGAGPKGSVWDLATRHPILSLPLRPGAFSPDGRLLICGGNDDAIHLWNLAAKREEAVLPGYGTSVGQILFSPDRKILATGSWGHEGHALVRLWDFARRRQIGTLEGHQSWVWPFAFSPNGKLLASISGMEHVVFIWDVATRRRIQTLPGNTDQINWMEFSPDGRTLGTGCSDGMIRLWSTASWSEVATMNDPNMDYGGTFSPDRVRLFTGDGDGGIRVWRADTPAEADAQVSLREHQREANRAEQAGNWAEAAASLGWLIHAQPKEVSYYIRRGRALMQRGEWNKAAVDLVQGFARGSDDFDARADLVRAQLAAGNGAGYRKACAAMLDRLDAYTTENSARHYYSEAAFLAALTPQAVADRARLVRMAEKALALQPQDPERQSALGAALYRAGRPGAAVRCLSADIAHRPPGERPEDWLFLAMAHHALGQPDQARRDLDAAERWIDRSAPQRAGSGGAPPLSADRRLALQLLRREAEALVMKRREE